MVIYKIFRAPEWRALCEAGETRGAAVDEADGFIHFSTAAQVTETAARHFAGAGDLILAWVDADTLGPALKWEPSRGGDLFPHLYRNLKRHEVSRFDPLTLGADGRHVFPDPLE